MKAQPLVTIIIPTYNRAHLIGETLDSVLAQTYQNWECLVIDDGSTDGTDALMQRYLKMDARFQYHHRPKNRLKGANACRNYGFEKSRGAYISFVDSDDIISSTFLEKRVAAFNSYECDYVIATTGSFVNGEKQNDPINRDPEFKTTQAYLGMFLSYRLPWTIMSITWKREILEKCTFDENLQRLQDVDFHIRVLLYGIYVGKRIYSFDNYYRQDKTKWRKSTHVTQVLHSLKHFLPNLIGEVNDKPELKKPFKKLLYNFIHSYVYPYYSENEKIAGNLEKIILSAGIFSYKEIGLLKLKKIIEVNSLDRVKGLGLYRLNKFIHKSFI